MVGIDKTYIDFLTSRKFDRALKIPRYLSERILKDRQLMKALCVYFELKPLFYDGRFKNGRKRRKSLALYLNMSFSAFNYKLKRLERDGFIHYSDNGDLFLCSWDQFFSILGHRRTDSRKYKFYRLKNQYANSEFLLRYFAVQENFDRQREIIDKKLYKKEFVYDRQIELLRQVQEIHNDNSIAILDRQRAITELTERINAIPSGNLENDPLFRKYRKKGIFNDMYIRGCAEYFKNLKYFNYSPEINFDISISCQRLANIFGLSSRSSGHYWEHLLNGHFWRIENRSIYIKDVSTLQFNHAKQNHVLEHHYFQGSKRGVFRRLNNRIELLPLERF